MLARIYNGESVEAVFGDVIFTVFKPGTINKADFQHAALCNADKITIINPADNVDVIEFTGQPEKNTWPKGDFEVHLVGKMRKNGEIIGGDLRLDILCTARKINRRVFNTIDNIGKVDCNYSFENYKCVRPDYNNSSTANYIRFTCSGFVEYCYEQADLDIVNEGIDSSLLPLVIHPNDESRTINRLFPGYQIKAFMYDKFPLEFNRINSLGLDPDDYQYYPF